MKTFRDFLTDTDILLVWSSVTALIFQTWPPTIVAVAAIANYAFEQWQINKVEKATEQDKRIAELANDVALLGGQVVNMQLDHADVRKQAEDVKKIVQQHNLKQMFGPKV